MSSSRFLATYRSSEQAFSPAARPWRPRATRRPGWTNVPAADPAPPGISCGLSGARTGRDRLLTMSGVEFARRPSCRRRSLRILVARAGQGPARHQWLVGRRSPGMSALHGRAAGRRRRRQTPGGRNRSTAGYRRDRVGHSGGRHPRNGHTAGWPQDGDQTAEMGTAARADINRLVGLRFSSLCPS